MGREGGGSSRAGQWSSEAALSTGTICPTPTYALPIHDSPIVIPCAYLATHSSTPTQKHRHGSQGPRYAWSPRPGKTPPEGVGYIAPEKSVKCLQCNVLWRNLTQVLGTKVNSCLSLELTMESPSIEMLHCLAINKAKCNRLEWRPCEYLGLNRHPPPPPPQSYPPPKPWHTCPPNLCVTDKPVLRK